MDLRTGKKPPLGHHRELRLYEYTKGDTDMTKGRRAKTIEDEALTLFLQERNAALLSLDEQQIRVYYEKHLKKPLSVDPLTFWEGVHKARTAIRNLPMEARIISKRWLIAHGYTPLDDGDIPV